MEGNLQSWSWWSNKTLTYDPALNKYKQLNNWTKYIFKTVLDIGQKVAQTSEISEKGNDQIEPYDSSDESF